MFFHQDEFWATIPKEDQEELNDILDKWSSELEYDCMDNERVALIGDKDQEDRYARQQDGGCCGSIDIEHTCRSGRQYQVGCNYGH